MTPAPASTAEMDSRRRRIAFRCWHRGTREMDLILGRFADACLPSMSDDELDRLEALLDLADQDLFAWITGAVSVPASERGGLIDRVRAFHGAPGTSADMTP